MSTMISGTSDGNYLDHNSSFVSKALPPPLEFADSSSGASSTLRSPAGDRVVLTGGRRASDDYLAAVIGDEILWTYVVIVCVVGVLLNAIVVRSLFRGKCNGLLHFVLQLSLCDMVSLMVAAVELRYIQLGRWSFPADYCSVYLGVESMCSTATVYLLIAINLHAISTYNLARKTIRREDLHRKQCEEYAPIASAAATTTDDDDYEVSVDALPPQQRSLTIDYRTPKTGVSVVFPMLFIWFLAASVSTPLFVLGSVMPNARTPLVCGIVNFDVENNALMQTLMVIVRIAVPFGCLALTGVSVALKICRSKHTIRSCGLDENVVQNLRLALTLSVAFLMFSAQRTFGSLLWEVWTRKPFMQPKYPTFDRLLAVCLIMLHWCMSALRPLLYLCVVRRVRDEFAFSFGCGGRLGVRRNENTDEERDRNEDRLL